MVGPADMSVTPAVAAGSTGRSPISAAEVARQSAGVEGGSYVGDEIWFSEIRPDQQGRTSIGAAVPGGGRREVLAAPWNARSRVHEYGGGAWTATDDGTLYFVEYTDQRIYVQRAADTGPVPITPAPNDIIQWRYGELQLVDDAVLCVREQHAGGMVLRDLVLIPTGGEAACDLGYVRHLVSGSHFLAGARLSPDRRRLAWIAWDHPRMPWDGTELRVVDLCDSPRDGIRTLIGHDDESVLQPEWKDDETLYALSDRSGYWNLFEIGLDGTGPRPLGPQAADVGGPLWSLGTSWYRVQPDGTVLMLRTHGSDTLARLDPRTGTVTDLVTEPLGRSGDLGQSVLGPSRAGRSLLVTGTASAASTLREIDHDSGRMCSVVDPTIDPDLRDRLPTGTPMIFESRHGPVHAIAYPPNAPGLARSPDNTGPGSPDRGHPSPADTGGAATPLWIAQVHGGPTTHLAPHLSLDRAFFTSRGIGVLDVNYGGSTGYGRDYRRRLRGRWGRIDVDDTVTAMLGLVERGLADPARLAIRGASAGGWTVLKALTDTDVFAAGICYFGVADLVSFQSATHDFESRYLLGLLGVAADDHDALSRLSPLADVGAISAPLLLLQGEDDPIVPADQARRLRDELARHGKPHEFHCYPGESHGFRTETAIADAYEREIRFLGRVFDLV